MPQPLIAADSQPCVWMCAGLIRYRLCERDFDCENCPLDAALRGEHATDWRGAALLKRRLGGSMPDDRLYSAGHIWIQSRPDAGGVWRVGIDALAAALLGCVACIDVPLPGTRCERGEPLCDVDIGLGNLTISAPVGGRIVAINELLQREPEPLLLDPYGAGWIAELSSVDDAQVVELVSPLSARRRLALDLRRFRRNLAFRLFAEIARSAAPSDDSIGDLRTLIAGDTYLQCISEIIR